MIKLLKILATTAAVAAVIPYKAKADENGGEVEGLFWKVNWKRDPDYQADPDVHVTLGFNNPFASPQKESDLFDEEVVVAEDESVLYTDPCTEDTTDACEADCVADEEPAPAVEAPVAPVAPVVEPSVVAPVEKCDCPHCTPTADKTEE